MFAKATVVVLLIAVILTLFAAGYFLVHDTGSQRRTLLMLKIRVALSITLILFLIAAYEIGWIHPHAAISLH